jgi:hypothetical protein
VHEVPGSERPLLPFDDQQALAGEDEEVLLVGLPVVHRKGLAWPEARELDPELRELGLALEDGAVAAALALAPDGLPRVEDEPAVSVRPQPGLGLFERRLGNHEARGY